MKLEVVRNMCRATCTIGELFINGNHACYTLEDVVRPDGEKIHGETAIPAGTYTVIINRSIRFGRDLPLLLDVPNFSGVRIHPGNTAEDTEGCLLLGTGVSGDSITHSRDAFNLVFQQLVDAHAGGEEITIEYRDA